MVRAEGAYFHQQLIANSGPEEQHATAEANGERVCVVHHQTNLRVLD